MLVLHQSLDVEGLNADDAICLDQLRRQLVDRIVPDRLDPLVQPGDFAPEHFTTIRPLFASGQTALHPSQLLLVLAQSARVGESFPIVENCKTFQTCINSAYFTLVIGLLLEIGGVIITFDVERDEPSVSPTADRN